MSHSNPRTYTPSTEIQLMCRDCIKRRGIAGAVRALGVSRGVLLAAAGGLPVLRGSLALLELARQRQKEAA